VFEFVIKFPIDLSANHFDQRQERPVKILGDVEIHEGNSSRHMANVVIEVSHGSVSQEHPTRGCFKARNVSDYSSDVDDRSFPIAKVTDDFFGPISEVPSGLNSAITQVFDAVKQ
jgi:hypothetical protein